MNYYSVYCNNRFIGTIKGDEYEIVKDACKDYCEDITLIRILKAADKYKELVAVLPRYSRIEQDVDYSYNYNVYLEL